MSIPVSQFIASLFTRGKPLVTIDLFSTSVTLLPFCFIFKISSFASSFFLDGTIFCDVCLSQSVFTRMTFSGSIRAAANDISLMSPG